MNDDIDEGVELSEDACRRIGEAADELIDVCDEECANPQEMRIAIDLLWNIRQQAKMNFLLPQH